MGITSLYEKYVSKLILKLVCFYIYVSLCYEFVWCAVISDRFRRICVLLASQGGHNTWKQPPFNSRTGLAT
jgi:hypothetical protein